MTGDPSRRLLGRIAGAIPYLVYVLDVAEGRTVYANARLADTLGLAVDEVRAMGTAFLTARVHPDDLARVLASYARCATLADGEVLETEYRMRRGDGRWCWLRSHDVVLARGPGGAPQLVLGVAQDVTAAHEAAAERERLLEVERAARVRAERLQRVTAMLAAPLSAAEAAGVLVTAGCAAAELPFGSVGLLATADGEVPGPCPDEAGLAGAEFHIVATYNYAGFDVANWERFPATAPVPFRDAVRDGRPVVVTTVEAYLARYPALAENVRRAGVTGVAVFPLVTDARTYGAMAFDLADGRVLADEELAFLATLAGQCAQALERARLLDAERAARAEAERANRAKSEFLAVMSHELRTPLNAIAGYVDLLDLGVRGPISDDQRADLARIRRSQRHLLGLIDEVLGHARLEAGRVAFHVGVHPVDALLAAAEPLVAPQAAARGLTFACRTEPDADGGVPRVRADAEKAVQVLVNLVANAVKFTAPGGRVEVVARGTGDGRVAIDVRDTGVGIAGEQLATIFEPFVQVGPTLTREHQGTGLGLAISRQLARGMGGDLLVESDPGAGSTFTLALERG